MKKPTQDRDRRVTKNRREDDEDCWTLARRRARHQQVRAERRKARRPGLLADFLASPEAALGLAMALAIVGVLRAVGEAIGEALAVAIRSAVFKSPLPAAKRPAADSAAVPVLRSQPAKSKPTDEPPTTTRDYLPPVRSEAHKLKYDLRLLEHGHEGPLSQIAWRRLRELDADAEFYLRTVATARDWSEVRADIKRAKGRLGDWFRYQPATRDRWLDGEDSLAAWQCLTLWSERGRMLKSAPPPPPPPAEPPDDPTDDPSPPSAPASAVPKP